MGLNEKFFKTAGGSVATDNFTPVLYTGTAQGGNLFTTISSLNFKPDWVWIKSRSAPGEPSNLVDSVRGVSKSLSTVAAGVESNQGNRFLTAFNNDGFTVGDDQAGNFGVGGLNDTYVAWCFKSGGASTTLNQDGNVNTNVSVNEEAGFSIIKTVNTDFNEQRTFGHGLGNVGNGIPDLFIIKPRTKPFEWRVYTSANSFDGFLELNTTATQVDVDTTVTSSTFKTQWTGTGSNFESEWIMYAFKAISGYSSFGTYSGNGSSQTITTGFAVRFVIIKCSTTTHPWMMYDSLRGGNKYLEANSAAAEGSSGGTNLVNFLSNGFSVANSNSENQSGQTFIYLAYA